MTIRQSILKTFYPAVMAAGNWLGGKSASWRNEKNLSPMASIYDLNTETNSGMATNMNQFAGKKILLVNTASDCGYTGQYAELEKLHEEFSGKLVILAFPANDFKNQEKGEDKEIEQFCHKNYGIRFPIMKKSIVVKNQGQNAIFQWLSDKRLNGWNDRAPIWNFCKYLVDENGNLQAMFGPSVSPLAQNFIQFIEK